MTKGGRDPSFNGIPNNCVSTGSVLQVKKKKIKDLLLLGAMKSTNNFSSKINDLEKEDLQMERRTLKLQMNVMKDENIRMKTRMAFLQ